MRQSEQWPEAWTREALLEYLARHGIAFEEAIHGAVFTMAESAALGVTLAGSRCKNLLVQDKKGAHRFLVVTGPDASIDLGALGRILGVGRLSLCPPEEMRGLLHVAPGALSPLALVADAGAEQIRLLLDENLRATPRFLFHPLVNTSTISMGVGDFEKFVKLTGHGIEYMNMPARVSMANAAQQGIPSA
ncbi:MAG: prolyl-tRNA synthetase associated domain-containing protein [Acidovorax sp.]